ncbi:MAG: hypothetical protein M3R55_09570 [Acidobacteriota bacterium]|nr:hypothetical protein [Acidobacteriota bacterium]
MGLSFQEKSLWLVLSSLVVAYGCYFYQAFANMGPLDAAADVQPHQIALFTAAVVLLVIMQVAGHVVIAMVDRRSDTDERDRLIGLEGTRNGAYVLAAGVFCSLCVALATEGNFIFTHLLLGSWVLAQLVETASQLVLHRRGA